MAMARSSFDSVVTALCTSGFVDDVVFSLHGTIGLARRYISMKFARQVAAPVERYDN